MTDPTIADFLLARITEDKAIALAASPPGWTSYRDGTVLAGRNEYGFVLDVADAKDTDRHHNQSGDRISRADATHIARWEPGRVLAECETKRQIVELHRNSHECSTFDHNGEVDNCTWVIGGDCSTLRLLALPYNSHPDYQQEWNLS